jgi:hypothetical protein
MFKIDADFKLYSKNVKTAAEKESIKMIFKNVEANGLMAFGDLV